MFQFKQFTIHQERTAMKVGTDGVLLGAWAETETAISILDIGTGTGLLALMTAQRNQQARVDAIEIEPEAATQAQENVTASPWHNRIRIYNTSIFNFTPDIQYDCILCNPPFFIHSTKNPEQNRTLARHSDTLPHDTLAETAEKLLTPGGCFYIILPPPEAHAFIEYAQTHQLFPARITHVLPNPDKTAKRYLMKFTRLNLPVIVDKLVIEWSRHQYSPEYIKLTRDFYLNM